MSFRTDNNNNPTAFTTDLALQAGLRIDIDFTEGDSFTQVENGITKVYYTARIPPVNPLGTTIKLIDGVGFYTSHGARRWEYIAIPHEVWMNLTIDQKCWVIGFMYKHEGGTEMTHLFPSSFPVEEKE